MMDKVQNYSVFFFLVVKAFAPMKIAASEHGNFMYHML
jgi:hypothetical protein